ncbi:uncharacterized protein LOC115738597 [Rhodamnia argentea]|uniref:Uncharacterized protein LOC115738597 n=1 Tax=Rhodamnia argentea TaxID=178133 RepID=A0A8B8NX45_9MYRT|nr:uncharacterized protein LOC115738597 [Rhodamnia argentea]
MASAAIGRASLPLLLFTIALQSGLLSLSVDARPCKTLLIAYSFSFTGKPAFLGHRDRPFPVIDFAKPDPSSFDSASSSSEEIITIFDASNRQFDRKPAFLFFDRRVFPSRELGMPRPQYPQLPKRQQRSVPLGFFDLSSLRDRTVDILSVVVALLFGVGCGALTAATMYLVWSLVASHRGDDFQEESDDEDASPKKMGYVKIPAADAFPDPTKA